MNKRIFAVLTLMALLTAGSVSAAEMLNGSKDQPNVSTSADSVHKNLYAAGALVTINSNTQKDLVVAGAVLNVAGNVEQDLLAAGGSINISGSVGSNSRVAGGNITINGPVKEDLMIAGGNVTISEKANIGGDLVGGAGNLVLDAPVSGNVKLSGGNITINSKISGNVDVMAQKELRFGPKAEVTGKITYQGPKEAVVEQGAKIGTIAFTKQGQRGRIADLAGLFTLIALISLLAWVGAALVLSHLFKHRVSAVVARVKQDPWSNLGLGFAGLVLTPIIVAVLFMILIGYYAALMLMAWYFLVLMMAGLLTSILVGEYVMTKVFKMESKIDWKTIVVGVICFKILGWIPFIGWLLALILVLMTFGSMLRQIKSEAN